MINKLDPRRFLVLQEKNSAKEKKKRCIDDFNDKIYISHLKIDSFGVLIAVCGHFNICTNHRVNHNDGKIMWVEPTLDGSDDLLTNLNNDDIKKKKKQLPTMKVLYHLLKDFEDFHNKTVIFDGDFNLTFDKKFDCGGGGVGLRLFLFLKKSSLFKIIDETVNFLVSYNKELPIFSFLTVFKNHL